MGTSGVRSTICDGGGDPKGEGDWQHDKIGRDAMECTLRHSITLSRTPLVFGSDGISACARSIRYCRNVVCGETYGDDGDPVGTQAPGEETGIWSARRREDTLKWEGCGTEGSVMMWLGCCAACATGELMSNSRSRIRTMTRWSQKNSRWSSDEGKEMRGGEHFHKQGKRRMIGLTDKVIRKIDSWREDKKERFRFEAVVSLACGPCSVSLWCVVCPHHFSRNVFPVNDGDRWLSDTNRWPCERRRLANREDRDCHLVRCERRRFSRRPSLSMAEKNGIVVSAEKRMYGRDGGAACLQSASWLQSVHAPCVAQWIVAMYSHVSGQRVVGRHSLTVSE